MRTLSYVVSLPNKCKTEQPTINENIPICFWVVNNRDYTTNAPIEQTIQKLLPGISSKIAVFQDLTDDDQNSIIHDDDSAATKRATDQPRKGLSTS